MRKIVAGRCTVLSLLLASRARNGVSWSLASSPMAVYDCPEEFGLGEGGRLTAGIGASLLNTVEHEGKGERREDLTHWRLV